MPRKKVRLDDDEEIADLSDTLSDTMSVASFDSDFISSNLFQIKGECANDEYFEYVNTIVDIDPSCLNIPFQPVTDKELEVEITDFNDESSCPICLDMLEKTWTVMTCLHRFCEACLHRSLRMNLAPNKTLHECPFCRSKIASRRSSTRDYNYDLLIHMINPSHKIKLLISKDVTESIDSLDVNYYRQRHEDNVKNFRLKQQMFKASRSIAPITKSNINNNTNSSSSHSIYIPTNLVNIWLCPWPNQKDFGSIHPSNMNSDREFYLCSLSKPYVSVPKSCNVEDLKSYLFIKQPYKFVKISSNKFEITSALSHQMNEMKKFHYNIGYQRVDNGIVEILEDHLTMKDICSSLWNAKSTLQIYFKFQYNSL